MADVAEKAVDMVGVAVSNAASHLEKVAPEVWRVMVKQQYAKALTDPVKPLIFLIAILICQHVLAKKVVSGPKDNGRESDDEYWARIWFRYIIPMVLGIIVTIWLAAELASSIKLLVNPEYYAFRDLLQIMLNQGR